MKGSGSDRRFLDEPHGTDRVGSGGQNRTSVLYSGEEHEQVVGDVRQAALRAEDIERVRFEGERTIARQAGRRFSGGRGGWPVHGSAGQVWLRRHAVRLSAELDPDAHSLLVRATRALGVTKPVELYQAVTMPMSHWYTPAEFIGTAYVGFSDAETIVITLIGSYMANLTSGALLAVLGHELGHYLAHFEREPVARQSGAEHAGMESGPSGLSVSRELTADRFGLLASGDLGACIELEMKSVGGGAADARRWDPEAYLRDCIALMDHCLANGEMAVGDSHPEHSLRAYATWLFSESDLYHELTGLGSASRSIEEVDQVLARLVVPPTTLDSRDETRAEGEAQQPADAAVVANRLGHRTGGGADDDSVPWASFAQSAGAAFASAAKEVAGDVSEVVRKSKPALEKALRGGVRGAPQPEPKEPEDDEAERYLQREEQELMDRFAALERKAKRKGD